MKKTLILLALTTLASASAATAPYVAENLGGVKVTLDNCTKTDSTTVQCRGNVSSQKDTYSNLNLNEFTLISSTGTEVQASSISVNDEEGSNKRLRANIPYPVVITFKGYAPNSALYFDMNYKRFTDVSFGGTMPAPARVTAPQPIKISNQNYTLNVDGCQPAAGGSFTCRATFTPAR